MRLRFLLPLLFSVALLHAQTSTLSIVMPIQSSVIGDQSLGGFHCKDGWTKQGNVCTRQTSDGCNTTTWTDDGFGTYGASTLLACAEKESALVIDDPLGLHSSTMMQAATPAPAQTWFPVAHDGDTISIPAGTVTQYGAKAGTPWGCGTQIKPLLADAWVTPKTLGSAVTSAGLGVADPAFCYVKELDVAETATVQVVTVNGKPVTVPALPVVTPPVTKQSYILSSDTAKPLVLTINSDGTWTLSGGGKAVKQ